MGGAVIPAGRESSRAQMYNGQTTTYVIVVALVAASGGLLFGFDNGVTGGVIAQPDFAARFFPETLEQHDSTQFCKFDDAMLQLFTSCLFLAGAVAALAGMWTSSRYGRKFTMMLGGLCFLVGTALVASAFATAQLVIGRVVLGLGVGFATQATPLYLSEMAPFHLRGALNIMFQLAVTVGILGAQLINYGTQYIQPYGWRISLALGGVPALILFLGSIFLPDTPNSLIERGHPEEGRRVLEKIRGTRDVDAELEDILEAVSVAQSIKRPATTIFRRRYWPQLCISIMIPIFQQWTGINAIMFYAPQLFQSLGSSTNAALLNTVVIGAVNVGSTVVAILAVDRLGRRMLFFEGGVQMMASEIIVGVLVKVMTYDQPSNEAIAIAVLAFICVYVAGFAWSWGPLGWLVPSEVQPLETRAAGTAINTAVNFLMTFIMGQCFLSMLCGMEYGVFFFFAGMVFIMTMFVALFVPETRCVPIEEVEEVRIGQHWFWKRIVAGTMRGSLDVEGAPTAKSVVA